VRRKRGSVTGFLTVLFDDRELFIINILILFPDL